MIICAAIKVNAAGSSIVICGHRHLDCIQIKRQLNSNWANAKHIEGFIDHNNHFLDRAEAFQHALECGQISQHDKWYREDCHDANELYSEDLY